MNGSRDGAPDFERSLSESDVHLAALGWVMVALAMLRREVRSERGVGAVARESVLTSVCRAVVTL